MDSRKITLGSKKSRRQLLCEELAGTIKRVQELYIRTKKASGNSAMELLCDVVEAIFLHELKNSRGQIWREVKRPNPNIPPDPSFWSFIEPMVPDDIKMQLLVLRNSESDVRKCRSWVRLVLVKGLLLTFLQDLQRHPGLLACHYGGDAVLRHMESTEMILGHLTGLSSIQLEYEYANPHLDTWDPTALHLAGLWNPPRSIKERSSSSSLKPQAKDGTSSSAKKASPSSSDFDAEGVSIIDLALDKYSEKKAQTEKFTDSELITKELNTQKTPLGSLRPPTDSVCSESEATRSYGAMLRSYARKNSKNQPPPETKGALVDRGAEIGRQGVEIDRERGKKEGGFAMALSMDYEIVTPDGDLVESMNVEQHQQHKQILKEHLTVLVGEQGMDQQNYQCVGCNRPIGLIFGHSRLCKYNGQHYCFDCHHDDERIIPARVLFNWDFRKHKVCIASGEYLDRIQHTKLLDVQETNKALYLYIPEIEETRRLRRQCNLLKGYLLTCKDTEIGVQFKKRLRHSYIFEHIHKYSMQDLIEVRSGALADRLRKVVRMGMKHIKQCMLCSQRGFFCEVCQSDEVIYPFDIDNTYQCSACNTLFHQVCKPAKGNCPKCFRMKRRANSTSLEEGVLVGN